MTTISARPTDPTPVAPVDAVAVVAPRSRMWTFKLVLLLGSMCAIGAFTTDTYLPSLPEVAADLATTEASAQFTITATLIGAAFGQFIIGPLSDRFGRRAPVLIGLLVHIVSSLLCIAVMDVVPLIALRIIQGFGNAAAGVTAIAIIRDRLTGSEASAVLSRLMLVIGVAPMLAPTIGGAIAQVWGWRAVFAFLALFGVVLLVIVWKFMPETLPPTQRLRSTRQVATSYKVLARDRQFLAFALLPGLTMAAVFSYVAASPFVIRVGYGLTESQFALLFAVVGLGLVLGAQLNAALVRRFSPIRLLRLATPVMVMLAVALFVVTLTGFGGLVGLIVPLWLMFAVASMVSPNASTLALQRHGERAGSAAALIGVSQSGVAALVAPLVVVLGGSTAAMGTVILGSAVVGFLVLLTTGAYRRGGWESSVA
ncbi:multidrug effflux MFS transporter [Pseudactinotalea suaedae]|uniref:multidrug effflux MFS transporter n=1 Tax=Pseudactinotalea suaedae TaxID=1524924 RepID=UPI001F5001FF|nr:multidrug effflux MFS transporter [Pseudactinotalea suaedae]